MAVIEFSSDQVMEILEWLEAQEEAGLDLLDVIEGLKNGHLSTRVVVTDYRHSSFSKPSENLLGVSEEV